MGKVKLNCRVIFQLDFLYEIQMENVALVDGDSNNLKKNPEIQENSKKTVS